MSHDGPEAKRAKRTLRWLAAIACLACSPPPLLGVVGTPMPNLNGARPREALRVSIDPWLEPDFVCGCCVLGRRVCLEDLKKSLGRGLRPVMNRSFVYDEAAPEAVARLDVVELVVEDGPDVDGGRPTTFRLALKWQFALRAVAGPVGVQLEGTTRAEHWLGREDELAAESKRLAEQVLEEVSARLNDLPPEPLNGPHGALSPRP